MVVLSHESLVCNLLYHTEGKIQRVYVCVYKHIHIPYTIDLSNAFMQSDGNKCTTCETVVNRWQACNSKSCVLFIEVQIEKLCSEVDHSYYSYSSCSKKTQRATG